MFCSLDIFFLFNFSIEPQHNVDMTMDLVATLDTSTPLDMSASLAMLVVLAIGDLATPIVDTAPPVMDYALPLSSTSVSYIIPSFDSSLVQT